MPPQKRHTVLLETIDSLIPGEGFVLVNDHDPKPLYHQVESEAGDEFRWEYRKREPGEFRVLIGKQNVASSSSLADTQPESPF